MDYKDILQFNLKSDTVLRLESLAINLPLPKDGLEGELYVDTNPLGDALVFGKKFKDKIWDVTSLFRVVEQEGKQKLELIRSEDPQERSICYNGVEKFKGKVLVAGAGIGVAQGILEQNKNVTSVTTVEEDEDVCSLIKKLYPKQEFVAKSYYEFFQDSQDLYDCIYIHPWNSFHYDLIPYLNTLVAAAYNNYTTIKAAVDKYDTLTVPIIVVWGYAHSIEEYARACLKMLKKATKNINTIKLGFDKLAILRQSSPLMASCIEYLREEYVKTKTGKWAPKVLEVRKLAVETALTSHAR